MMHYQLSIKPVFELAPLPSVWLVVACGKCTQAVEVQKIASKYTCRQLYVASFRGLGWVGTSRLKSESEILKITKKKERLSSGVNPIWTSNLRGKKCRTKRNGSCPSHTSYTAYSAIRPATTGGGIEGWAVEPVGAAPERDSNRAL